MVSVIFCQLLTFSIWDRPKIYIGAYVLHGLIRKKTLLLVLVSLSSAMAILSNLID
jgi:hypothetical protein